MKSSTPFRNLICYLLSPDQDVFRSLFAERSHTAQAASFDIFIATDTLRSWNTLYSEMVAHYGLQQSLTLSSHASRIVSYHVPASYPDHLLLTATGRQRARDLLLCGAVSIDEHPVGYRLSVAAIIPVSMLVEAIVDHVISLN